MDGRTAKELVKRYLDIFHSGERMERLFDILSPELNFHGPFFQSKDAKTYVDNLSAAPCENCRYRILQTFEEPPYVNVLYEFSKPGISTLMSQLFRIDGDQIAEIVLIFDTGAFQQP